MPPLSENEIAKTFAELHLLHAGDRLDLLSRLGADESPITPEVGSERLGGLVPVISNASGEAADG